jgi:hypothetical protein
MSHVFQGVAGAGSQGIALSGRSGFWALGALDVAQAASKALRLGPPKPGWRRGKAAVVLDGVAMLDLSGGDRHDRLPILSLRVNFRQQTFQR